MSDEIKMRQPRLLIKELEADGVHLKESARLHPLNQPMDLNTRLLSTATLTLPETDPDLVVHDLVELYSPNGSVGIFWVVGQEPNYGTNRVYKLNHAIDTLSAAIYTGQPAGDETYSGSVSPFLTKLLGAQKQKLGNTPLWQLGVCEDTGTWKKEIAYDNVLEDFSELEKEHEDYHFTFDFDTFPWTVNFVRFTDQVLSEFRVGRNATKVKPVIDDSEMCTRLYLSVTTKTPAPAVENDESTGETETQAFYTFDYASGQDQFGPIERAAGIESDKVPNIQAWVDQYFKTHGVPGLSLTIDGEEYVRLTGEPIDEAHLGYLCRVAVPRYTVLFTERIITVHYTDAVKKPRSITVSLANKRNTLAGSIASVKKETAKVKKETAKAARGGSAALRKATDNEKKIKKFETKFTQTDEKFSWLATESEWDELAQAGHVTAFTELTRTARYVEDSAKMELPFEDWKGQWLIAHPEDSELTDPELQEKYNDWIKENPYAIYNTEYSDATRTERIISKTGIDALGANETVLSRITQEAERVESSVYASQSQVYSAIGQTASNIRVELANTEQSLYNYINLTASGIRQQITNAGNRTIVNDTDPRGETYSPKEGDIWIESVHDGTWDGADGFDWEHDEDYDWTQVQGAKVWTWKNDQWQLVADRQQLVTYSDFVNTADILISQKIAALANEEGQVEVYRSLIEQSAESIRAEVYGATSDIYSYIHQTASSVSIAAGNRPTTVVQNSHTDGVPTSINGRGLKENDIWIDTADQQSWDAALDFNWNDDLEYDWNELRSDKIYVYRNGEWQLSVDGTVLAEDTDLQIERDHIALLARNIDTLDGYARENFAQLQVRADKIYSEVIDRTNGLGSRITQTATQIRSEVYAANSPIYSEITQTASNILLHVENEISDMGASLEVTASQIRSEVHAAQSSMYSSITQTASQIRSEVNDTKNTLQSSITQNANQIALKVSKGDISSTINQTAQSVLISASKINLEGYVTATELDAEKARFDNLTAGRTKVSALKATTIEADYVYGAQVFYNGSSLGGAIRSCSASSSNGIITLTFTKYNTDTLTVNFNMADTAFFTNAMSAQWAAARAKVQMPSQGTETTFTVKVPSATEGEQETKTFTIQTGTPAENGYASVALDRTVVGRIAIGDWYTAGKTAAHAEYTYHTGYLRGNSVSVTPIGSTYVSIKGYGLSTLYKKNGDNYESVGNHYWYYRSDSGTKYYNSGTAQTYYTSGGFIAYYTRSIT